VATVAKDWDQHVLEAEEVARGAGFRALRDRIVDIAGPTSNDVVVDIGAGTGLLTLPLAERTKRVWAIDISPAMCEYLRVKASSAGLDNIETAVASAASLPLVDGSVDVAVSNYCLHHLDEHGKRRALAEAHRVLRPGGRLVVGDMMFQVSVSDPRDRKVVASKVRAMMRKGPAGFMRLAKNGIRFASGRWERPARADWWSHALASAGFVDVQVTVLEHEGGIASAVRR
jgi:ubiquinone/menaquinone biosynthesis C-methylase UbiE